MVIVFSPAIVVLAFLCSLGTGGAAHNNATVEACFYGTTLPGDVPEEFQVHVSQMQTAFSLLDSAVSSANSQMEDGNSLAPIRIKAIFYTLCFGDEIPSQREATEFVKCFYTTEARTRFVDAIQEDGTIVQQAEPYTVAIPLSMESAFINIATLLGHEIPESDKDNINSVYTLIAGPVGGLEYDGTYLRGSNSSNELSISEFTSPSTKNSADLVAYAIHAWENGWGYVWGTYGNVLTESLFEYKLNQYPDGVGKFKEFIRTHWLDRRTTDCVGLIKGYGWLDPDTMTIRYGTNSMPDIGANSMYRSATVSGPIGTIPDTPGLAVWMDGHIGVYIGNGEVIEASSTRRGVVKTQLAGRGWTHWLKIPYINYES